MQGIARKHVYVRHIYLRIQNMKKARSSCERHPLQRDLMSPRWCTFLLFRSGLMPIPGSSCMIIVMCQKDSKRFVCITSKKRYCSSCLLLFRPGISSPNRVDSEGGGFAAAPSEAAGCNRSPRASSERQEAAPEGENGSQPRVDQGV